MRDNMNNAAGIMAAIAKGWKPNRYLSNMSMAAFADPKDYVATKIFPMCPVANTTGFYYEFLKGDISRDNVQRKPVFGKVQPAKRGHTDKTYKCEVDQILVGVDEIGALDYSRSGAPASIDPRRSSTRFVNEQMLLHLDLMFADNFFKTGVWDNQFTGIASGTPGAKQFLKFTDANFDPVHFFDERKREIRLEGRRTPNKLCLGYDAYLGLKAHPDILERVKYGGSTPNPAIVNEFLSTPSARRATCGKCHCWHWCAISIHALREEGDTGPQQIGSTQIDFYPRPPRGGRPEPPKQDEPPKQISIHALREEGDGDESGQPSTDSDFYPRPPRGGRHYYYYNKLYSKAFLSTPSARRATAKTETKSLFSNKLYNILHEFRRALIYNGSKSYPNHAK